MQRTAPATIAASRVRALPNAIRLVTTQAGEILVNSPPETLKYLLAGGLPIPAIVLLPPDLPAGRELGSSGFVRRGINYASVEFLIYSNYFARQQKLLLVTVTVAQAERLHTILNETICGPQDPAAYGSDGWLRSECAAVAYFPPLGRSPMVDDMITIVSLETGGGELGATTISLEDDEFVFREDGVIVASVTTAINEPAYPLTLAPPHPIQRRELTLQFIGGSDGFDPVGITTCFLAYLGHTPQSKATLFDAAAYLLMRLGHLGIAPGHISEVVLSHVHEDHLAGLPELILMGSRRVRLVTSTLIYHSLLRLLSAMLALPVSEVAELFDFVRLDPGTPLDLDGRRFEAIYAIHSIPTIAVRVDGLCYSGDMRYDEEWFASLEQNGILHADRREELLRFAEGASVLVQDAGGGAIHSTITPRLLQDLTAKSQRLVLAHTSQHQLPITSSELAERVEFAGSGMIVGIGAHLPENERSALMETIAACPLFARLSNAERQALAERVEVAAWPDGATVLHEGEPSDGQTYVVHAGMAQIIISELQVRTLGRGSSIGERGAIMGAPRSSTIAARGALQMLRLRPEVFQPLVEQMGLAEAFTRANWLAEVAVLCDLPWASLLDLALDFEPRRLAPGEALFTCGETAHEAFLLVEGALAFFDADGGLLDELNRSGELFGGHAVFSGQPRRVTAVASCPTTVWALPATALTRLHMLYPNLLLHMRAVETYHLGKQKA